MGATVNRQERERLKESDIRVVTRKRRPGELMVHSRNDHHGFKNSRAGRLPAHTEKNVRQYSTFPFAHNAQTQSQGPDADSKRSRHRDKTTKTRCTPQRASTHRSHQHRREPTPREMRPITARAEGDPSRGCRQGKKGVSAWTHRDTCGSLTRAAPF